MTTLQQSQPPIICYEIWEYKNETLGSLVDFKPWWKAKQDFLYSYDLKGREAHYFIVTDDGSLTKADAIAFAKAVHDKKVRRIHIDLLPCQPRPIK